MSSAEIPDRIWQFIAGKIDTVPQLEALLLLWEEPRRAWSAEELAARIYVERGATELVLQALQRRQLAAVTGEPGPQYRYDDGWDTEGSLMAEVAATYRRCTVQVATFIHSRASTSVREFARAFDFKRHR